MRSFLLRRNDWGCLLSVYRSTGVAVWGQPGDSSLLSRGPRFSQKGPLRTAKLPPKYRAGCRGLDGLL